MMSKKPTDAQLAAFDALDGLCKGAAHGAYLMARAEGKLVEHPTDADVLLEWYYALDAMREKLGKDWPGVTRRHRWR